MSGEIFGEDDWEQRLAAQDMPEYEARSIAFWVPLQYMEKARSILPPRTHHYFLGNNEMPESWISEFIADPQIDHDALALQLAGMPGVRDKYLPFLVNSKSAQAREKIARMKHLPIEFQRQLVKDKSIPVRAALAQNPTTDIEILKVLSKDKSASVLKMLNNEKYWDDDQRKMVKYTNRDEILGTAKANLQDVQAKANTKTVGGRADALQAEIFDKHRYDELMADKAIGIQVSATLRAAELGLITFEAAAKFVEANAPSSSAPRNRWVEARLKQFKDDSKDEYLDLVIALRGDWTLAETIEDRSVNFTPEQITKIIKSHMPMSNWALSRQVELTADLLDELAETPSWSYEVYGEAPAELHFGSWMTESNNGYRITHYPQAIAAANSLTRRETLAKLHKSRSKYVRGVILQRTDYINQADIVKAAKDKEAYIRALVAKHPMATLELLEQLASDSDPEVRKAACDNPIATPEIKALAALIN